MKVPLWSLSELLRALELPWSGRLGVALVKLLDGGGGDMVFRSFPCAVVVASPLEVVLGLVPNYLGVKDFLVLVFDRIVDDYCRWWWLALTWDAVRGCGVPERNVAYQVKLD